MWTSADELNTLSLEIVPKESPPHPTAVAWVEQAMENSDSRGRIAPITTQAQYDAVRTELRRAAASLGVTVTCHPEESDPDNLTALLFTVGQRRGRKTSAA